MTPELHGTFTCLLLSICAQTCLELVSPIIHLTTALCAEPPLAHASMAVQSPPGALGYALTHLLKQLPQEIFVTGKEFQIGMVSKDAVVMECHLIAQA